MLVEYLKKQGKTVLQVKEPGTTQLPLTMTLRKIMLDQQYSDEHTDLSRELVSQAIRSIQLNKLIIPAIKDNKYDYIISDRGVFSSVAYGVACGNSKETIEQLTEITHQGTGLDSKSYDIVFLKRDVKAGLATAKSSKQEFANGDAMENKGVGFLDEVSKQFSSWSGDFNVSYVNVENKNKENILKEIISTLGV